MARIGAGTAVEDPVGASCKTGARPTEPRYEGVTDLNVPPQDRCGMLLVGLVRIAVVTQLLHIHEAQRSHCHASIAAMRSRAVAARGP